MNKIWGHRGAPAECPENTLKGFARAKELGCIGIELDVHLSADGHLIVMHDETVDRTTNGTGEIRTLTLEQIKTLDAGSGEPVPTLTDVLDLVGDSMMVDIEVKANEAGAATLDEVRTHPNLRWLISSFDWDVLRYVRSQDAEAELWVLSPAASDDALQTYRDINASALAIWTNAIDADIARMFADQQITWWPWTVNDPDRATECLAWGARGICTDNPALLLAEVHDA